MVTLFLFYAGLSDGGPLLLDHSPIPESTIFDFLQALKTFRESAVLFLPLLHVQVCPPSPPLYSSISLSFYPHGQDTLVPAFFLIKSPTLSLKNLLNSFIIPLLVLDTSFPVPRTLPLTPTDTHPPPHTFFLFLTLFLIRRPPRTNQAFD